MKITSESAIVVRVRQTLGAGELEVSVIKKAMKVRPGGGSKRPPAPGGLRLVQDFVNTRDIDKGRDQFVAAGQLRAWLQGRGLLADHDSVDAADLKHVVEVRESLRALLLANNGAPVDTDAIAVLDRAALGAHLALRFTSEGQMRLVSDAPGVAGALGRILAATFEAFLDGSWSRLKACRSDECHWAFYDRSRNRSGKWCTMALCGNRWKARTFRQRHREARATAASQDRSWQRRNADPD